MAGATQSSGVTVWPPVAKLIGRPLLTPSKPLQSAGPPALSSIRSAIDGASSSLRMSKTIVPSVVGTASASPNVVPV